MKCSKLVGCTILLLVPIATGLQPAQATSCSILYEKSEWPELVGVPGCNAAAIIERENKHVHTTLIPVHGPVTGELRCDRVRVFIDHTGAVAVTPRVA